VGGIIVDSKSSIDSGGNLIFCNILEQESRTVLAILNHIQNSGGDLSHYASYFVHYYCNQTAINDPLFLIQGIVPWGAKPAR